MPYKESRPIWTKPATSGASVFSASNGTLLTRHQVNVLKMADVLWERYAAIGWTTDVIRYRSPNGRASDMREALRSTALSTYCQFCRRHDINIDWVKR